MIIYYWRNDTNTQLNPNTIPQNPVFHSYTRCFSQICIFTHTRCCALALHNTLFIGEWRSIGSNPCATNYYHEKSHGSWKKVDKFATNLHLGKIFPSNPRDQSLLPPMRYMALHPEGAQHREVLIKSKQCWNLIPETHFVSMFSWIICGTNLL